MSRLVHAGNDTLHRMGHHRFSAHLNAPREQVFDLWVNLDRLREWIVGLTRITDVTGPPDQVGTRYTAWFGRSKSLTEVLEADPPRLIRTRFGNGLLGGTTQTVFEDEGGGTRLTEEFWTDGFIPNIAGRIFSIGSWKGSFRGELNTFVKIAEPEAGQIEPSGHRDRSLV
jgi:hypothetical protein